VGVRASSRCIGAALAELVAGREDLVVGDADLAPWTLSDRELPEGDTLAERYARRPTFPPPSATFRTA
jgi:hypothetical protein